MDNIERFSQVSRNPRLFVGGYTSKPDCTSTLAQSPINTQGNRGLFVAAFGAIGGAV
jgi:hypothetical protein